MITVIPPKLDPHSSSSLATQEHILLQDISWETFNELITELESQPSKRLTYGNGQLEIWMPVIPHESYKRWLGRILELITEELDIEIPNLGSTTWRRQDLAKGIEADECYYIQNEAATRGKMDIDLTTDPPPDLAIGIHITSVSLPRLPIYSALGIPEIWRFDGESVQILALHQATYREVPLARPAPNHPRSLTKFPRTSQNHGRNQLG